MDSPMPKSHPINPRTPTPMTVTTTPAMVTVAIAPVRKFMVERTRTRYAMTKHMVTPWKVLRTNASCVTIQVHVLYAVWIAFCIPGGASSFNVFTHASQTRKTGRATLAVVGYFNVVCTVTLTKKILSSFSPGTIGFELSYGKKPMEFLKT